MPVSLTRRQTVFGLAFLAGAGLPAFAFAQIPAIARIERRHGGRLGVFAVDTGSGRTMAHRADERFLMCSTFKGLLAAQVLARVDAGRERLDDAVPYGEADMIFTSPVTKANLAKGAMPVGDLLQAMLERSDNTAAVLLMRRAGGPEALTRFVRSVGDSMTRSDRYEPDSNDYDGDLDTTSPRAVIETVRKVLLGDVLSPVSRDQLEKGMIACKPGLDRIRATLPADWLAGDRPGTSVSRETNDFAIIRPPGRAPLLVAAYYDAPKLDFDRREAVLREVGKAFVRWAKA